MGMERHTSDPIGIALQRLQAGSSVKIPNFDYLTVIASGDNPLGWVHGDRPHPIFMPLPSGLTLPCLKIPKAHCAIKAAGGEGFPVGPHRQNFIFPTVAR